jgi:hypothetical protein
MDIISVFSIISALSQVLKFGVQIFQKIENLVKKSKDLDEFLDGFTKTFNFDKHFESKDAIKIIYFLCYLKYLFNRIIAPKRAIDELIKFDYPDLRREFKKLIEKYSLLDIVTMSSELKINIFSRLIGPENDYEASVREVYSIEEKSQIVEENQKFLKNFFDCINDNENEIYKLGDFLCYEQMAIVKSFIFSKIKNGNMTILSTGNFSKDKITERQIESNTLEYLSTLGGAWLLDSSKENVREDWIKIFHDKPDFKLFIQHPFQPKVVLEVIRRLNIEYPTEMIRVWKTFKNKHKVGKRIIWAREYFNPVANIGEKNGLRTIWLEKYEQSVRTNITGSWIEISGPGKSMINISMEDKTLFNSIGPNHLIGAPHDERYTELIDITNIDGIINEYFSRQIIIDFLLDKKNNDNFYKNIFKVNLFNIMDIDTESKKGILFDARKWTGLGFLDLILFEVICARVLIEFIFKNFKDKNIAKREKEAESYEYTFNTIKAFLMEEYFAEISNFNSNLEKFSNCFDAVKGLKIKEKIEFGRRQINKNLISLKESLKNFK